MHIQFEVWAANDSVLMSKVDQQVGANKKDSMLQELYLRFRGAVNARVTFFRYQQ